MNRIRLAFVVLVALAAGIGVTASFRIGDRAMSAPANVEIQIGGTDGVPDDAVAAVVNLTAARAHDNGYMVAWPCDEARPEAASLNFGVGAPTANTTIVALDPAGKLCLHRSVDVDVVVDINGFVAAGSSLQTFNPVRLHDSRVAGGSLAAGEVLRIAVAGRGPIAAHASAASLNIAAVRSSDDGHLIAWPCTEDRPDAAALNFRRGENTSNTSQLSLSDAGEICLWSSATTHVVVDANGAFPSGSPLAGFIPRRLIDTRANGAVDGGQVIRVPIPDREPGDSAVINVAATRPRSNGYIVAWSCDGSQPLASIFNYDRGAPRSNSSIVGIGGNTEICLMSSARAHLVVDLHGALPVSTGVHPVTPRRLLDTRTTPTPPGGDDAGGGFPRTPLSGDVFMESFDTPASMQRFEFDVHHRSDHDHNVDPQNNHKLSTETWLGDHDRACGGAGTTRTLNAQDRSSNIYWCREHMMTSMAGVDGYSTIAFSPRQSFPTVSRVCWDQNVTDMGGRQWTAVVITPDAAHGGLRTRNGEYHLASGSLNPGGSDRTGHIPTPDTVAFRLGGRYGGLSVLQGGSPVSNHRYLGQLTDPEGLASRAIRRTHCITDNGNGTLSFAVERQDDTFATTIPGSLPINARVVFEDHSYVPEKDPRTCGESQPGLTGCRFTWHWDNVVVAP